MIAVFLKIFCTPVLYGVFLYMGVSSLKGVQFVDRLKLIFMPTKHQPDLVYLRHVPFKRVMTFTAFQVGGMVILWTVKSIKPYTNYLKRFINILTKNCDIYEFFSIPLPSR